MVTPDTTHGHKSYFLDIITSFLFNHFTLTRTFTSTCNGLLHDLQNYMAVSTAVERSTLQILAKDMF